MQGNKKWVISTVVLALILVGLLGFLAGRFFSPGGTPEVPVTDPADNTGSAGSTDPAGSGNTGAGTGSGTGKTDSGTGSSGTSGTTDSSGSTGGDTSTEKPPVEVLTPRQILDSSMYWANESKTVGLCATAGGNFDVMIDDEVFKTTQIIQSDDVYDGFTYNIIMEMESYVDDRIASTVLYCHQMDYGEGIHIQFMRWDGTVEYLEPTKENPLKKFAQ